MSYASITVASDLTVADYFTPCDIEFGCVGDPWYDRDLGAGLFHLRSPGGELLSSPLQLEARRFYREIRGAEPFCERHGITQCSILDEAKHLFCLITPFHTVSVSGEF